MKRFGFLVYIFSLVVCLTGCLLMFEHEPQRTIEIYNPSFEEVKIKCYWFIAEDQDSVIEAYGRRTYRLDSYVSESTIITIFAEGTFYEYYSQKVSITDIETKITLTPNVKKEIVRKIVIYNSTIESVKITCHSFGKNELSSVTIPGHGSRTFTLGSWVNAGDVVKIFEDGTYFCNANETFVITGETTNVTLRPNCSIIKIYNATSSTIRSVHIGSNYVGYNPTLSMSTADSSISPGSTMAIRCTSQAFGYVEFKYNNVLYRTTSAYASPNCGDSKTIFIHSSTITKKYNL